MDGEPITLIVEHCPEKSLAYKNTVYCSEISFRLLSRSTTSSTAALHYVLINHKFVYPIESHRDIKPGHIGLTGPQRENLRVDLLTSVSLVSFEPILGKNCQSISKMSCTVELISGGRRTLKEQEIVDYMKQNYMNRILNVDQVLLIDQVGITLKLCICKLQHTIIVAKTSTPGSSLAQGSQSLIASIVADNRLSSPTAASIANINKNPNQYVQKTKDLQLGLLMPNSLILIPKPEDRYITWQPREDVMNLTPLIDENFDFTSLGIGGLSAEFNTLFRDALATRLFHPGIIKELGVNHVRGILLHGVAGCGKCMGAGTELLMYSGEIKKVENIIEGDLLMGDDSTPREVLAGSLIRDQGELFRIIPNAEGQDAFVCNAEHLLVLTVNTPQKRHMYIDENNQLGSTESSDRLSEQQAELDVLQIPFSRFLWCVPLKDYLRTSHSLREHCKMFKPDRVDFPYDSFFADTCSKIFSREFSKVELEQMAWILGLWLTDTMHTADKQGDESIFQACENWANFMKISFGKRNCDNLDPTVNPCGKNTFHDLLDELSISDKKDKHIPFKLKTASYNIRLHLLAGILDGDGYKDPFSNRYELSTNYLPFLQDISFLCRSLGLQVGKITNHLVFGHRISIMGANLHLVPVVLPCKKSSQVNENRWGFTVESLGMGEYYGFAVDGNRRFLLKDFTVTHNTTIARKIGQMLKAASFKVVKGPELLDKFVGGGEANVRKLFESAEQDQKNNKPGLHIIVFDEFDALGIKRGSSGTGGASQNDGIVTQLLSKIDGVDALNNILLIALTNRKELLDPALLRPGRFEVHIEIALPDEQGRLQILEIHTATMKQSNRMSLDVDLKRLAANTRNFSGAELEGLIKKATALALFNGVDVFQAGGLQLRDDSVNRIIVTSNHFNQALRALKPALGSDDLELKQYTSSPLYHYGPRFDKLNLDCKSILNQVMQSNQTTIQSLLLYGNRFAGKSSVAAQIAKDSAFPFVRFISASQFIGNGELQKIKDLQNSFEDAYRSALAIIILDDLENLIDYVETGPRFSTALVQMFRILTKRKPPNSAHRLFVIATTSDVSCCKQTGLFHSFQYQLNVPHLNEEEIELVLKQLLMNKPIYLNTESTSILKLKKRDPISVIVSMLAPYTPTIGSIIQSVDNALISASGSNLTTNLFKDAIERVHHVHNNMSNTVQNS